MTRLSITEHQFNELYPDLIGTYSFFNTPPAPGIGAQVFEQRYLSSKLWRLNNLYTVVNKQGNKVIFRMNYAQHRVYATLRKHPRGIILKSRQQGISTFWLISFFDDSAFRADLTVGLMAQGVDEAATLLERAKLLWDCLSPGVKQFLNLSLVADNAKKFSFSNGSSIFIRVSFRSATLQRLHISEFGKIANANPKRAKETMTGTLQALAVGNTGVIESTAEGKNLFKTLWDSSMLALHSGQMTKKDFYPIFLSWLDDADCVQEVLQTADESAIKYFAELELKIGRRLTQQQKNFWIVQRRELGSDLFQEYPALPEEAFMASRDGTYYSKLFSELVVRAGRVIRGLYDENLPTDAYFDLGVDDYTVYGLAQWYRDSYRIVGEECNSGKSIGFYLASLRDGAIPIRAIVLPHDAKARAIATAGEGLAKCVYDIVLEWIKENKLPWIIRVQGKSSILDGIEAVRRMIPKLSIDTSCTYLISCLHNYSKEWDDTLQVWRKTPLHDEYSHGADVLRGIATGLIDKSGANDSSLAVKDRSRNRGFAV